MGFRWIEGDVADHFGMFSGAASILNYFESID